jgi:hypothetical protein
MPLHYCHPNTPHKKLKMPEWYISTLMMDRALDAVVRRVKKLDRAHDIPYLAGYSKDGKVIYIDRHMPSSFRYQGREINTDRYLILHEEVEKTLIDQLNLHYLHAHQIASRAEQAAVRAAGINWRDYDRFMQDNVKHIGDERLTKVPADLDLKPYRDEHDYDLVQRMLDCIARGEAPAGIKVEHVEAAIARHMPHLKMHKAKASSKTGGGKAKAKPKAGRKKAGRKKR